MLSSVTSRLQFARPRETSQRKKPRFSSTEKIIFSGTVAVLLLLLCYKNLWATVWDDAYMHTRYSENFLKTGGLRWNSGDPPAYGLTSLLYFPIVLFFYVITGRDAMLALSLSSGFCGVLFIVVLFVWIRRSSDGDTIRSVRYVLLLLFLGLSYRYWSLHFTSGMDTPFQCCVSHSMPRRGITSGPLSRPPMRFY